jgi:hypothetical protein
VWAARVVAAEAIGGRYANTITGPRSFQPPVCAGDQQHAQALWQMSEEMVVERFNRH